MCRLFGMTSGRERVRATFWLLEAPDNLSQQSRRNPDGTGLGTYTADGNPLIEKQPIAAFDDTDFAAEAKERESSTFVAHVRFATGTAHTVANTHPFEMDGRLLAHNGAIGDLPTLEQHLGDDLQLVHGDTDSERIFALITREIRSGATVSDAITTAVSWIAANLPVLAINLILTTETDLWALRYPETHELWMLDRRDPAGDLDHRSEQGTHITSSDLSDAPGVVVASERLDQDARWTLLDPGTLLHIDGDLNLTSYDAITRAPAHPLHLSDFEPQSNK